MRVRDWIVVRLVLGCERKRKGEKQKHAFLHTFMDIRQGVLQSDCVMLFGAGLEMMQVG